MRSRINAAIEFLKDNQSFLVGDLQLGVNAAGDVQVTGWSHYSDSKNLSKATCLEELSEVKQMFSDMLLSSGNLQQFVKYKAIEYCLNFDDYGEASISICSEKHNQIKWYIDFK